MADEQQQKGFAGIIRNHIGRLNELIVQAQDEFDLRVELNVDEYKVIGRRQPTTVLRVDISKPL